MTAALTTVAAALDGIRLVAGNMHDEALRYLFLLDARAFLRAAVILAVVVAIAVRRARRGIPADVPTSRAA